MISAVVGFLAGSLHVLSGPDHLAAVAPLALEGRRRAWLTGFRWGVGHACGVGLVGFFALLLRGVLPIDWLSSWSERLVGVVLVGIGLWGFHRAFGKRVHSHVHLRAAVAVGTIHGLAGSSHLLGVLPALAFPSKAEAVAYLVAFGAGTILAMASFSSVIGWAATKFAVERAKVYRGLLCGFSAAAIVVGSVWLVL